jgi:hypothetical protein
MFISLCVCTYVLIHTYKKGGLTFNNSSMYDVCTLFILFVFSGYIESTVLLQYTVYFLCIYLYPLFPVPCMLQVTGVPVLPLNLQLSADQPACPFTYILSKFPNLNAYACFRYLILFSGREIHKALLHHHTYSVPVLCDTGVLIQLSPLIVNLV